MRSLATAVALSALWAVASAQGTRFTFPYATCTRDVNKSQYSTGDYSTVVRDGLTFYCWTFKYSATCNTPGDYCCAPVLDKFALDARGECANGTRVIATLNGVRLRNPRIDQPPNAQPGQFHMHVSNLRLLRDAAQDAEVCFSLSGTCSTLEEVLPDGVSWKAALWDDKHKCCPLFGGGSKPPAPSPSYPQIPNNPPPAAPSYPGAPNNPPPSYPATPNAPPPSYPPSQPPPASPSPSPSPSPTPVPRPTTTRCPTCWAWVVSRDSDRNAKYPYFVDADGEETEACVNGRASVTELFADVMNDDLVAMGFDNVVCEASRLYICGSFNSPADAQTAVAKYGAQLIFDTVFDDECPSALTGWSRRLTAFRPDINGEERRGCGATYQERCSLRSPSPAPVPTPTPFKDFPFCACVKAAGSTRFRLGGSWLAEGGSTYCQEVLTNGLTGADGTFCAATTGLFKIEFHLDWSQRLLIKSVQLRFGSGLPTVLKHPFWGPISDNTLRVSGLDWDAEFVESARPRVCIQLKGSATLDDIKLPGEPISTALFDPTKKCCPTYTV